MRDINSYLESGLLEAYCLGTLSEAEAAEISLVASQNELVKQEINRILSTLQSNTKSTEFRPEIKDRLLSFLEPFLVPSVPIDLKNPPILDRFSSSDDWNTSLEGIQPEDMAEGLYSYPLLERDDRNLNLVWLSTELIEEAHAEDLFVESFLILEGACECNFDGVIVRFSAGDYFEIPANTVHTIKNISVHTPWVKGLVQRRSA